MQNRLANLHRLNWDDLRLLLAVAGHASLLEAGRALGLATTTVSRRIAALESCVGSQLLLRTHAGTRLTPTGEKLVQAVKPLAVDIDACTRTASGADSHIAGAIKVSVAEGLAPLTLEAMASFRQAYPGVNFELDTSHRSLDMAQNEADVALRMLRPRSEGLVVRRICSIPLGVYRASGSAASSSPGRDGLGRHEAVLLGGELLALKETVWLASQTCAVSLRTATLGSLIDAVRQGIGVGVIPDALAAGDPALHRLCGCEAVPHKTLWLVMNLRTAQMLRVRLFTDHITAHLRRFAARPA